MSEPTPNVTTLVGKKKKKKKFANPNKLSNSPFWSKAHLSQCSVGPGVFRPSLQQVSFTPAAPQAVVTGLNPIRLQHQMSQSNIKAEHRPPIRNVTDLIIDDNSPKTPDNTVTTTASSTTNIILNTTANNVKNIPNKPLMNVKATPPKPNQPNIHNKPLSKKQRKKANLQRRLELINKALAAKQAAKEAEEKAEQQKNTATGPKEGNKEATQNTTSNEKVQISKANVISSAASSTITTATTGAEAFTIPVLNPEIRRSTAGSFFKTTLTQSKQPQQPLNWGSLPYAYKYPKGIPRSFLTPQQAAMISQISLNLLFQQPRGMSQQPGVMPQQPGVMPQQPGVMPQQPGVTSQQPRVMPQQPGVKPQQPGVRPQQPGSMLQESVVQQTINPEASVWPIPSPTNTNYQQPIVGQQQQTLVSTPVVDNETDNNGNAPIFVQTENTVDIQQPYSPSDIYAEQGNNPDHGEDSQSSEVSQGGQKRLSAFQRLGPVSQPKKPKLTINLTLNKEQPVREVVNDTEDDPERYTPVHLRKNIIMSTDDTVMKYLTVWPWRKNVGIRRSATARNSRSVMILEQEQMEEAYERDHCFIQISVKGYPASWTKERVLDAVLESVKGYSLIPCFTEFYHNECKFLCLRSRSALIILHKTGFYIHKDGVELSITISQTDLTLNQIDFIPRIILRKRIAMAYENQKLNLSAFTLQDDISHFIYFPLSRLSNQSEFMQLQSVIDWNHLLSLDLSHNRLTDISGFDLHRVTPRLKNLDLSHNYLDKITILIGCRELPLKSINLEGNPLCNDYIDTEHYIKVIRMLFPEISEIDGVPIHRSGKMPIIKKNYCPGEAKEITEKFLETFFPLIDSGQEHRSLLQDMYEDEATLTITYCYKLRYSNIYRNFRNLFLYARFLEEGETDSVMGAMAITKLINRWPQTEHDPHTFTVDVIFHSETTTILRISGILRLVSETLAEEEFLLAFTRTVVLYSEDGTEYKIQNEMVYWNEPSAAYAKTAFVDKTQKKIKLKIESTTDEDLRENLLTVFMKLTTMERKISQRCFEINNWDFKLALEHFTKLLKLNNLDSLIPETVPVVTSS